MKGIFTRILEWPAWLIGAVIFAQALTVLVSLVLNGHLIWSRLHPQTPAVGWSLDSTTYYKNLYQQGKLNYDLYLSQKTHEEWLGKLDRKRQARYRHIDSLSGTGLQHELDSLYTGVGQPAGGRPARPQTNAADGSGSPAGAKRPGRPAHATGRGAVSGYSIGQPAPGDPSAKPDDQPAKPASATTAERWPGRTEPGGVLPAEVARSQTGKLDLARSPGVVRGRQVQINLTYWRLIRAQQYTYPDVAFAISAAETGYWWSSAQLADHGHNLFGMKKNPRGFYARLSAGGYCLYDNPLASLDDYGVYEQFAIQKYGLYTQAAYIDHICLRFCPNPAYRGKLDLAFQALRKIKPLA